MIASHMSFPAPRREWGSTGSGYASIPWTLQGVCDVFSYGGWFRPGSHDFQDAKVAKVALGGAAKLQAALEQEV